MEEIPSSKSSLFLRRKGLTTPKKKGYENLGGPITLIFFIGLSEEPKNPKNP